jgi:polyribonucleotide nucleotidyltransferase
MFNVYRKEIDWGGRMLVLETGKIARQADAAVMVTYGSTTVLCTVVGAKKAKEGIDFFPLTVNYQEKTFAAGRIPGGYFKREGRPTERETLTSRLIDRPIRPLFAEGFRNEVQVVCTVLSHDLENESDIPALIGTSAALTLSGLPFLGPVGAARVAYINGEYVLNPTITQFNSDENKLELVVAGTTEGVLMVESEAKELPESVMLGAVNFGHQQFQPIIQAIVELAEQAAKEAWPMPDLGYDHDALKAKIRDQFGADLKAAYAEPIKQARYEKVGAVKAAVKVALADESLPPEALGIAFKDVEAEIVRFAILDTGRRIDGRDGKTIRPIVSEVDMLPRAHGSALFTRGETQALVVATLGTSQDEQIIDSLTGEYRETFMLHYNFPPYSVGETGRMGSPGRREIGHGKLAWRALHPLLPSKDAFPYTLRLVSEITESNGSSSMATVCGSSLALMDAGVPLVRPCAGIAMGLIKEGDRFAVLSDIMGDEDHLGDMDFKVAGSAEGITSLQMDLKITSINSQIMEIALGQAKEGRLHILGEMAKAISNSREGVNANAPRITVISIPKDKIREVIGTGGKVIREIVENTGAKVDIEDDGTIRIAAVDQSAADAAINWIKGIVAEPEIGVIYTGKVVKVMDFGAFVNFLGTRDGLVHISELAPHRVAKTSDIVNVGDEVKVKVLGFDDRGKIRLSMKVVDQATGEDISQKPAETASTDQAAG